MTATDKQNTNPLAAIIFAVFAVSCIVAFLAYRGSDVGQLPNLIGNLGGGPLFGNGVYTFSIACLLSLLMTFSWVGLGDLILKVILRTQERPSWLMYSLRAGIGAIGWSIVWFVLGICGAYKTPIAIVAFVLGLFLWILAVLLNRRRQKEQEHTNKDSQKDTQQESPTLFVRILPFLLQIVIILSLISAIAPPTAKDALLYHYALPKAFVTQGSNAFVEGNIASYLALGTEMLGVWAKLLGNIFSPVMGEALTGATVNIFFVTVLTAVYGWASEIGLSPIWALMATVIVATIPTAYHVASSGYIDLSLALYVTLATYSLTRWWKEQPWGWVILMAIFLGAAMSVKLTAIVVIAAFALIMLLRARGAEGAGEILIRGFAALLLAGVIASPWYIRTWVATGSPVFPFYMSIWPGKANGWDVERSNLFQGMNSQYGGADVNKINYLTAPVRASIMAQPEQPADYDGVLGVAFLIGLPLLVWALWKFDLAVEIKIMAGVAGVMYLFWLFSSEQLRYLLPILPMLAIGIAASAEKIGGTVAKIAKCSLIAALVCGLLTIFAWFCQKAPLRVVLGGETSDQYLTRNLDYYPYYQSINADTPVDAKVWLINMRRDTYNIERPVFSDYLFEDWTLRKMVWESRSVDELRAKVKAMGISYVLARHDFLLDYDRSTLVDDKRPRAENGAKLKIARDFILDPANTIRADDKFSLIKVF